MNSLNVMHLRKLSKGLYSVSILRTRIVFPPTVIGSYSFFDSTRQFSTLDKFKVPPIQTNAELTATGFNLAIQRAANIVLNVTDRQTSKILHFYPENSLTTFLGKNSTMEIIGLSEAMESSERKFREIRNYREIQYIDYFTPTTKIDFSSRLFHIAVLTMPPLQDSNTHSMLSLEEMVRVVADRGFLLLGCPSTFWDKYDLMNKLTLFDEQKKGDLLSVQMFEFKRSEINSTMAIVETSNVDDHSSKSQDDKSKNQEEIQTITYMLALYRNN